MTALVGLASSLLCSAGCAGPQDSAEAGVECRDRSQGTEESLRVRISEARAIAKRIEVDGQGADWDGLFAMGDRADEGVEPGGFDITAVRVAPLEEEILVRIDTRGVPVEKGFVYSLDLDLSGGDDPEFWMDLHGAGKRQMLGTWPRSQRNDAHVQTVAVACAMGSVIECRIPHAELVRALAAVGRGPELPLRPWIRVRTSSWGDSEGEFKRLDDGPSIASYRLTEALDSLDSPSPAEFIRKAASRVPFVGCWYVGQGAKTDGSHSGEWAYDFQKLDQSLRATALEGSKLAKDRYIWGLPVIAPERCTVLRAVGEHPDHEAAGEGMIESGKANLVEVRLQDGAVLSLVHLLQNSVSVTAGDNCERGHTLGRVGNSGPTSGPHVHVEIRLNRERESSSPLVLRNVRLRLNPAADDPWERVLDKWLVREGYFVEDADAEDASAD